MDLGEPLRFIQERAAAALRLDPVVIEQFVATLQPAKRVFLYGRGRSGFVARAFAVRLMHLGYATYVVGETITAPVQKDDVVILVSGSGTTYPVVMTAEIGRKQGATVVAVTADPESDIARRGATATQPPERQGRPLRSAWHIVRDDGLALL
jgi:6-phospho-3-hexuloisomerase